MNISVDTVKKRQCFVEALRILACFFVIVNHTNSGIFYKLAPSATWFASVFYFFAAKTAVPVFLMISGYTMLDRQDSYQKTFGRFLRFACTLILFSGFYYIAGYLTGDTDRIGIKDFVSRIFGGPVTVSYWYLYLYLGVILMLPFLQKLVSTFQKTDFHVYFLVSGLFFAVWPVIAHYIPALTVTKEFSLPLFNSYICMLLLGCYLKRYFKPSKRIRYLGIAGFFAMCLLSVLLTYAEYVRRGGNDYLFFDDIALFPILVSSVCLFCAAATFRWGERAEKMILPLGRLTFGIYLIADFLILRLAFLFPKLQAVVVQPMAAMLIFQVLVFACGGVIAWLLKKIPGLKRLL